MSVVVEEGVRRMRRLEISYGGLARKLKRSGYAATVRHQVVKDAIEKFERMCKTEDDGGRQIRRAREWQEARERA